MRVLTIPLAFLLLVCGSKSSQAVQIREVKPLGFGVFAILDTGSYRVVVETNGTTTTPDGGIHKLRPGQNAVFMLTGFDPQFDFYVTIDPTTIAHTSGSPVFNIDSYTFDPPNSSSTLIHADPDGSLQVNIGATLRVPAATPLTPGNYRGTYNFMINF